MSNLPLICKTQQIWANSNWMTTSPTSRQKTAGIGFDALSLTERRAYRPTLNSTKISFLTLSSLTPRNTRNTRNQRGKRKPRGKPLPLNPTPVQSMPSTFSIAESSENVGLRAIGSYSNRSKPFISRCGFAFNSIKNREQRRTL